MWYRVDVLVFLNRDTLEFRPQHRLGGILRRSGWLYIIFNQVLQLGRLETSNNGMNSSLHHYRPVPDDRDAHDISIVQGRTTGMPTADFRRRATGSVLLK